MGESEMIKIEGVCNLLGAFLIQPDKWCVQVYYPPHFTLKEKEIFLQLNTVFRLVWSGGFEFGFQILGFGFGVCSPNQHGLEKTGMVKP